MSENWDVTDAEGTPTGKVFRRGAPGWPEGRFHVVAATCAYRLDGMVLLTQRAASKEFPLGWEFPGGSALARETSAAAARRELHEETGLRASPASLAWVGRFPETSALIDLYVTRVRSPATLVLDPAEVAAAEWVPLTEVEQRLRSGTMASPWVARLDALWVPLVRAIEGAR
ncbi:hypothetical protein GCM10023169_24580 [Georgenia halophila]|uniref:Nudix hydrolase domain-containing protein n=1 Tax=Georgenia halophila TaxID=620889 RepID=A0ABP8LB87_9MICO